MDEERKDALIIKNQNQLLSNAIKIKEAWEEGKKIAIRDKSIFVICVSPFNKKAVENTIDFVQKESGGRYYLYPYLISDERFIQKFAFLPSPYEKFLIDITKIENLVVFVRPIFNFHPRILLNGKIATKLAQKDDKFIKILGGVTLAFPYIKNGTPVFYSSHVELGDIIVDINPESSSFKPPSYIEITEGYVVKFIFEGEINRYDFKNKFEMFGLKVI